MKILYGIQGTGNGHVSRAREIIPELKRHADVDIVLSGTHSEVNVGHDIKFRFHGLGFVFGKKGNVSIPETIQNFKIRNFIQEIRSLPVDEYDLIIQDVEPVTAWACRLQKIPCVEMSHQISLSSPKTPKIKGFHWGKFILNHYTPHSYKMGFHFQKYDDFIHTPVIRSEIRNLKPVFGEEYLVYLPAFGDIEIQKFLSPFTEERFRVFSKHSTQSYDNKNIKFEKIDNHKFISALANCKGLITGAGFESPAEAIFLNKKLMCVPMSNQYEQLCNAKALEELGIQVVWSRNNISQALTQFLASDERIHLEFPDETAFLVDNLVQKFRNNQLFTF
ncbi:MAG: glycosyltransferase family protein [Flavobacteriaceae bacterium]|nr:glycosyltransferase family protein [Flavobacteriaceae bacterium]